MAAPIARAARSAVSDPPPGDQPSILGRPHDRVPAGIPYALQMLEDVGTTVRNRDEDDCPPADGRSS